MTTIYWYCLGGGLAVTLLLVVAGDVLESALDALDGALDALSLDVFDPLSFVAAVTVFGGAGLVLESVASLPMPVEAGLAAAIGVLLALVLHVVYVRPMKESENSTGFSVREYAGKSGELTTGVPAGGYGEVLVRMGASTTFQTAASFTGEPIPTGTAVVVVEVDPDGTLRVAPLAEADREVSPEAIPIAPRLQTRV